MVCCFACIYCGVLEPVLIILTAGLPCLRQKPTSNLNTHAGKLSYPFSLGFKALLSSDTAITIVPNNTTDSGDQDIHYLNTHAGKLSYPFSLSFKALLSSDTAITIVPTNTTDSGDQDIHYLNTRAGKLSYPISLGFKALYPQILPLP